MNSENFILSREIEKGYEQIINDSAVKQALQFIQKDHDQTTKDQIEITEIPAPTFHEKERGMYFMDRLKEFSLEDIKMDDVGNVYGVRKGTGNGPKIFVSAHMDNVFTLDTDTTVKEKDGILYAPGIGDDARGMAELLSILRAFEHADIEHEGDIIFGSTVCEEGLGNLKGVKHFFNENKDVNGFISIDVSPFNRIIYNTSGSCRYKVTYKGPGGHAKVDFGTPSAIHALGRAVAEISELKTNPDTNTTFTVSLVDGGQAINAIASEAELTIDLRSDHAADLEELSNNVLNIIKGAATKENDRWNSDLLTVNIETINNSPPSTQSQNHEIVQCAYAALDGIKQEPLLSRPASTDASHPMTLGVPAVTLGIGGNTGGEHTLDEWFDPKNAFIGVQKNFLTVLGLVGLKDTVNPLLK